MRSATFQFGPAPFGCSCLIVTSWISLPLRVRLAIFKHSASSEALLLVRFCCSFLFASWTKCWETWECDEFPRARTSFERALHLKTTCFAPVGDILKAVDKENRHGLRYGHLAFAIWTSFHSRHYGTRQVGAHDTSFRPTECRGEQKAHPG